MKTTFHLTALLSIAFIASAALFSSCSGSQAEVNKFITSLNDYNQSIQQVNNVNELHEVNATFEANIQEFASSDVKLTDADRNAIIKTIGELGKTTNEKFAQLSPTGTKPLTDEQYNQRLQEFENAINSCQTLGDIVSIGL